MPNIRQFTTTIFLFVLFVCTASSQTCQTPSSSQLFANSITLSSARLNCNSISGASLYQFQYRQTGSGTWTIGTSSSQNFTYLTGLLSYSNYQFQCRVFCNGSWTAYSASQSFATNSGGNTCANPNQIGCAENYVGSNNTGSYVYSGYSFANSTNMTGPEAVHKLTIVFPALVNITMAPQTQDLDLFLLSTCGNTNGLASSQYGNTTAEQISINLSPGTYYLIVDGWNGAVSNYSLNIQCTQSTNCTAPAAGDIYTADLTCSSVRLHCSAPNAYVWSWAYRALNSANWTSLSNTSTPYADIIGLQPNTAYEFISAIRCSNNTWSAWSPAKQFNTPGCGLSNNNCSNPIAVYCSSTYSGNNGLGTNNYNAYSGSGVSFSQMYGPEIFYQITMSQGGPLSLSLTGLAPGKDLDLIMLSGCNSNSIIAASGNGGNSSEYINIGYLAPGTYKIVVDGWNYAVSNYLLSVQCGIPGCPTPAASQLFASNLAGNAARINCTYQGASSFRWQYRPAGSTSWIVLGSTSNNYVNLTNLIPNTEYEFQCSVYCSGSWTAWSPSQLFNSTYPWNNEPCGAYALHTASGCYPVIGTNIAASTSWYPSPPGNCNTVNMRDVWYKVLMPSTGKVKISTFEGSLKNALVAFYYGSCNNMTPGSPTCFDNTGDDLMPDVTLTGQPGTWWYIRVWGYNGSVGTFSICAQTVLNLAEGDNTFTCTEGTDDRVDMVNNDEGAINLEPGALSLRLFPVPAHDEIKLSTMLKSDGDLLIKVVSLTGQMMKEESRIDAKSGLFETILDIGSLPAGAYLLHFQSGDLMTSGKFYKL